MTATATAPAPRTFAEAETVLAASLPGYTPRIHQQALAAAIEDAMASGATLLAEAGTGTGKSLAALIAAILTGQRVVLATATKALQTQYAVKDLPFLDEHLGTEFLWSVLKGRSNYACAQKISDLGSSATDAQQAVIDAVAATAAPEFLDRDQLPRVTDPEWRALSMSAGECPGARDCPFAKAGACHPQRAKEAAARANIVVTNTAYLATDLKLAAETQGLVSLLGPFDYLIVDEGHNLDAAITSALEDRIAAGTMQRLAGDAMAWLMENNAGARAMETAQGAGYAAQLLWQQIEQAYEGWRAIENKRTDRRGPASKNMLLTEQLRFEVLGDAFQALGVALTSLRTQISQAQAATDAGERLQQRLERRVGNMIARFSSIVSDPDDVTVRWIEDEDGKMFIRSVPVSPAPFLREHLWSKEIQVTIMSATLATGRGRDGSADFTYVMETLGLDADPRVRTFEAGTTFDYAKQALIYVPDKDRPIPSGATMTAWRAFAQQAMRVLVTESGGGAMLLFTSRSAMEEAWKLLADGFEQDGMEVLKQGDLPTAELVARIKEHGNAVLFALRTFFEGVDIPGDALRLVVIDKLPFPVPTDLQFAARCEKVNKAAGRDVSFGRISMPMMSLPLIQAAGRLVRTSTDRGVIAILDPRLTSKGYGSQILRALPPARRTTDPAEAVAFLKAGR